MAEMDLWIDRFGPLSLRFLEQDNVKDSEIRLISACMQNMADLWSLAKMVDEVLAGKKESQINLGDVDFSV